MNFDLDNLTSTSVLMLVLFYLSFQIDGSDKKRKGAGNFKVGKKKVKRNLFFSRKTRGIAPHRLLYSSKEPGGLCSYSR